MHTANPRGRSNRTEPDPTKMKTIRGVGYRLDTGATKQHHAQRRIHLPRVHDAAGGIRVWHRAGAEEDALNNLRLAIFWCRNTSKNKDSTQNPETKDRKLVIINKAGKIYPFKFAKSNALFYYKIISKIEAIVYWLHGMTTLRIRYFSLRRIAKDSIVRETSSAIPFSVGRTDLPLNGGSWKITPQAGQQY